MIDKENAEVEELEEIVVDLSEDEDKKSEEPSNTEVPVTEEVEEDSDEIEADDQEIDDQPEEIKKESEESKTTEEDSKKVFGKRAEKRIKRLVAQKKELEEKLETAEQEKNSLRMEASKHTEAAAASELESIRNYIEKLGSQEKEALTALKIAKEGGNVEDEIKATDTLATVKAEALVAQQYRARAEHRVKPKESLNSSAKTSSPQPAQIPDRKAVEWQKRNRWFGGKETSDRIMSQAAIVIHKELLDDGINPALDSEEYYNELDARLRTEFPEKYKHKGTKKVPTVIGGVRATLGSSKVKLSKTEVEMANRLGVELKEYARQKQRQLKAGG